MELLAFEREVCAEVGVSEAVALLLKNVTGNMIERASRTAWDTRQPQFLPAISSVGAPRLLDGLRSQIPSDYRAYYGQRRLPDGRPENLELLITTGLDPLFIVRGRLTDGANYRISHKDVVAKLEEWKARFDIDVRGADHDFVELRFKRLPADLMPLVEEIYWFCSGVTEPGGDEGDQEREPEMFARAREFPEPSPQFFERLSREYAEVMGEGWELNSAPGLRLLAAHLERDSTVYLWWD